MLYPMSQNTRNGFTLVELAISLMVIGLLLGGILKGRELIENAKITAMAKQMKSYDAATVTFLERYSALPGDIESPAALIPKCSSGSICLPGGNGDGIVGGVMNADNFTVKETKRMETCKFFSHLYLADLTEGPPGSGSICNTSWNSRGANSADTRLFPESPFTNVLIVPRALGDVFSEIDNDAVPDFTPDTHYYNIYPLTVYQAHALDKKFDDGYALSGNILVVPNTACHDTVGVYLLQTTNPRSGTCQSLVRAAF